MQKKLTLLLFFSLCLQLYSQEPLRFTTKQGLPTNHVYDMAQDVDGFMWFATKQGLLKYDGETFTTFTTQDGLPNNDTWELDTDYQGKLYYFSKSAYQGYIIKDSIYKFSVKNKEVLAPRFVYKSKTNFWFNSSSGIKFYSKDEILDHKIDLKKHFEIANELLKRYNLIREQLLYFIDPDKEEAIFLNVVDNKMYVYDYQFNLLKTIPFKNPNFNEPINFRGSGKIYNQLGYYAFQEGVVFVNFKNYTVRFLSFDDIFNKPVNAMYFRLKSLPNQLQISIPGHLAILDYNLTVKETYQFSTELGQHSYKDTNGNIWLTSITKGISLLKNTQVQSQYNFKNLKVQKINVLDSIFYVGVNNTGLFTFDKTNHAEKKLLNFTVPHTEIYQIKKDKLTNKNTIVTAGHVFQPIKGALKKLQVNNTIEKYLDTNTTGGGKDYFTYNNSSYLVNSTGIVKCGFNKDFSEFVVTDWGLSGSELFKNNLYIYGSNGLFHFKNEQLVPIKASVLNSPINTLFSNDAFLFIGTDGRGLYLFDEKEIYQIKSTDGLSIQRIIAKNDAIWLATQKGVYKVQLDNDVVENSAIVDAFFEADGLQQNNTNDIYLDEQKLYVASDVGITTLNLSNPIYKTKPTVYFKTQSDTLTVTKKTRDAVAVSFASLDYVNQEHLQYQYRLLPNQKEWITTATKTINFSNLAPNNYTLEVKVTNQHNKTSTKKLFINVIPLWWETIWAKIMFGVIFMFVIFMFVRFKIKQIRVKEQAKAQQEKRIVGLELQALRSQMNPHFVHNSLNAIQYYIQRKEVELSENYLSKFSQLIRLFFEYSRRQNITIKEEVTLLKNYLEIEKLRFEEKLNFQIKVADKIDQEEQLIPSMILQPIVENAVNHGIFHKNDNGLVTINFSYISENNFQVVIADDGIGINKSKDIFKSSSKNYQSNSSQVLQERLELLNQSNEWEIVYSIKDALEINQLETGTIVTLQFKQKEQL